MTRHDPLRATWSPGQVWQTRNDECAHDPNAWVPVGDHGRAEPKWDEHQEYRRVEAPTIQQPAVPPEVMAALDRMSAPLHESWGSVARGATAAADARDMQTLRDYIMREPEQRAPCHPEGPPMTSTLLQQAVEAALRRSFQLGQTYWQQADSESPKQHVKADVTQAKFFEIVEETLAALQQQPEPVATFEELFRLAHGWAQECYFKGLGRSCDVDGKRGEFAVALRLAPPALQQQEGKGEAGPIDMLLFCPDCGEQHIDAPEYNPTDLAGDEVWRNPPHKSHLCHGCGCIWRPANVPTNGVASGIARGKADTWSLGEGAIPTAPASVQALIRACYNDAACFPEAEDPRTSDWLYDDNHLCAEAIRKRGEETAKEYVARLAPSPSTAVQQEAGSDARPVTAQEDRWLRDAAKRSSTLVAYGKLAAAPTQQPPSVSDGGKNREEALRLAGAAGLDPDPDVAGMRVDAPADPFTVSAALHRLIADDAYAMTFQTFGQYRTALLKAIEAATAAAGVTVPDQQTFCGQTPMEGRDG